jgi:hypothetical protein
METTMTTKIICDTHAGWEVEVLAFDPNVGFENGHQFLGVVPPHTQQTFSVWDTRALVFYERRKEPPKEEPEDA